MDGVVWDIYTSTHLVYVLTLGISWIISRIVRSVSSRLLYYWVRLCRGIGVISSHESVVTRLVCRSSSLGCLYTNRSLVEVPGRLLCVYHSIAEKTCFGIWEYILHIQSMWLCSWRCSRLTHTLDILLYQVATLTLCSRW